MPLYDNTDMFNLIDERVHSARDRKVLKDKYINGLSDFAIAQKYGLSSTQIWRIKKKYEEALFPG